MTSLDVSPSWDGLILRDATLTRLTSIALMLRSADTLHDPLNALPKTVLLFGQPGTGKTLIARTLASESGRSFIAVSPTDLRVAYNGQSGRRVRERFEEARRVAPCTLFLDDLQWSAVARDGRSADHANVEIITDLVTQMDGLTTTTVDVFVLAATEDPSHVDSAVLSRFEERIELPQPGLDERRRMLKTFLGTRRVDFDIDGTAEELATLCEGLSGRDLRRLVQQALQQAAERAVDSGDIDQLMITRADLLGHVSMSQR